MIARLIEEGHGVIATGGGAFIDSRTRRLLLDRGIVVWLDCGVETLVARTSRRDTRPLLRGGDAEAILSRLHRERAPAYGEAHIHIATDNLPHQQTALRIVEAVAQWL